MLKVGVKQKKWKLNRVKNYFFTVLGDTTVVTFMTFSLPRITIQLPPLSLSLWWWLVNLFINWFPGMNHSCECRDWIYNNSFEIVAFFSSLYLLCIPQSYDPVLRIHKCQTWRCYWPLENNICTLIIFFSKDLLSTNLRLSPHTHVRPVQCLKIDCKQFRYGKYVEMRTTVYYAVKSFSDIITFLQKIKETVK